MSSVYTFTIILHPLRSKLTDSCFFGSPKVSATEKKWRRQTVRFMRVPLIHILFDFIAFELYGQWHVLEVYKKFVYYPVQQQQQ